MIKNKDMFNILIVDDEREYREVLQMILEEQGYMTEVACDGVQALKKIKKGSYDLILSDLIMEGMDGIELLERVKEQYGDIEVIIITGYGSIENAVEAMKKGAFTYFIKSHDPEELLLEIEKVRKMKSLENDNMILRNQQNDLDFMLYSNNKEFRRVIDIAQKAAKSNVNILILGESGVGKEVLARYIHNYSDRRQGHFIAVNCHAFSEGILESELFGHEKGAFTGAVERRKGRFEAAHGGTLFLDEIGDVPLNIQVKLLRAVETKKIERIGSNRSIDVDYRLISATNRDLNEAVSCGEFREDLYYRISTITIEIPPLRKRKEDISILIDYFIKKTEVELKKKIKRIEKEAMDFLLTYDYPGNVREMKNIIERTVVLSEDGIIRKRDIMEYSILTENGRGMENNNCIRPLKEIRKEMEARYIKRALEKCNYNITETAKKLHISRRHLFNKITEYNIK